MNGAGKDVSVYIASRLNIVRDDGKWKDGRVGIFHPSIKLAFTYVYKDVSSRLITARDKGSDMIKMVVG